MDRILPDDLRSRIKGTQALFEFDLGTFYFSDCLLNQKRTQRRCPFLVEERYWTGRGDELKRSGG
jgi:hypothetical protein